MKVSLKEIYQSKETLKYIQGVLRNEPVTKGLGNKLEKIIRLYEEVETDLEISGESIIELNQERLEAIKERNKVAQFNNNADDV